MAYSLEYIRLQEQMLSVDIKDVAEKLWPDAKLDGKMFCCPVHGEKTPSAHFRPTVNRMHCFGCGGDWSPVDLVMQQTGRTYREAVEWICEAMHLAAPYWKDGGHEMTLEEKKAYGMQKTLKEVMQWAHEQCGHERMVDFLVKRQMLDCDRRKTGNQTPLEDSYLLGYVPEDVDIRRVAEARNWNMGVLHLLGVIAGPKGAEYTPLAGRVVFPIRDRLDQVVDFTARENFTERYATDNPDQKKKKYCRMKAVPDMADQKAVVYGIREARAAMSRDKERKLYVVEGQMDALRLAYLGVQNVVCLSGSVVTKEQLAELKAIGCQSVCLIPDIDSYDPEHKPWGTGIDKALTKMIGPMIEAGFRVSVKEIPTDGPQSKTDADSYWRSQSAVKFDDVDEVTGVVWYAQKYFSQLKGNTKNVDSIRSTTDQVSRLLLKVTDRELVQDYISALRKPTGVSEKEWKRSMERVDMAAKAIERTKDPVTQKLKFYDMYQDGGSLYRASNGQQVTDFTVEPKYYIKEADSSVWIAECKRAGSDQQEVVRWTADDLASVGNFTKKQINMQMLFYGKDAELKLVNKFVFDNSIEVRRVRVLGWQKDSGVWAWGNGIMWQGQFVEANAYGVAMCDEKTSFWLPSCVRLSGVDKTDEANGYQFEQQFSHNSLINYPKLEDTFRNCLKFWGDAGKVMLMFLTASVFMDVVKSYTRGFPILVCFGPPGSGKSTVGEFLNSFFMNGGVAQNINTATKAALDDTVAHSANSIMHIDEYRNTVDEGKIEWLKAIWDGTGRSKMAMESAGKGRVNTVVKCTVCLTGQDVPTRDIALMRRICMLEFYKASRDTEIQQAFQNWHRTVVKPGLTGLTNAILMHREDFQQRFPANYHEVFKRMSKDLSGLDVNDSIITNWAGILASMKTLENELPYGFSYEQAYPTVFEFVKAQNNVAESKDERANFWLALQQCDGAGELIDGAHYKIVTEEQNYEGYIEARKVLYLHFELVEPVIRRFLKQQGKDDQIRDTTTLSKYLKRTEDGWIDVCKKNVRMDVLAQGGKFVMMEGSRKVSRTRRGLWMFDYNTLSSKYNLSLGSSDDEEEEGNDGTNPW